MTHQRTLQYRSGHATVLLVEDEVSTALPLIIGLQDQGFRALHATEGRQGLEYVRVAQPDLVLLDAMLPRMDGFSVCRTLRQKSAVPILLLITRKAEQVHALEAGADGCLVKPFQLRELLARVRATLRRRALNGSYGALPGDRIALGDIVLDRATRQVWRAGCPIKLRRREFELLGVLMENAGHALSRHALLDRVWGEDWVGDPRTLDVHICWLRSKLGDDPSAPRYIQTVHGYGYRFVASALRRALRRAQDGAQDTAALPADAA